MPAWLGNVYNAGFILWYQKCKLYFTCYADLKKNPTSPNGGFICLGSINQFGIFLCVYEQYTGCRIYSALSLSYFASDLKYT